MLPFFLFLLLFSTTISAHNRRVLHQPFFPSDSLPPSSSPPAPISPSPTSTPKYPFDSSTTTPPNNNNNNGDSPFFPSFPSPPPPPSPSAIASFPVNISSLTIPHPAKSKPVSTKLIATAIACVLAAFAVLSLAVFLHIRKRRNRAPNDVKSQRSNSSSRVNSANGNSSRNNNSRNNNGNSSNIPKLQRPSQTSSEFLYLGTMVSSHGGIGTTVSNAAATASRKMDSPEIHPLPPLHNHIRQNSYAANNNSNNNMNADVVSRRTEEDEEFYSPRGSLDGSIGTGSASRRAFAAVQVENFGSSSSYSSSSSGSGSPARSVSLSISPPVSLSPKHSLPPKSPELVAVVHTAPPPPQYSPPPPPQLPPLASFVPILVIDGDSASPSPPSSTSPERYSSRSIDSSPRFSSVWDQNLDFPVSLPLLPPLPPPLPDNIPANSTSPERYSSRSIDSSPRFSNVCDQNLELPASPPQPPPPPPQLPVQISIPASIPPPPPPPPCKNWDSPKTPTPPTTKPPSNKPPVLVTPLRPIELESPALISPMELPSSENNEDTPKPKLKTLHWDKVRASSDREMVWDQLKSSSFKLDEEMIETLFVVKNPTPNPKEATKRPILPFQSQENRVLDPKKSQNIAILLRALNVTVEEVCEALLEGNADALGTELLESLLKMAPSKEEERKLKEYKDDSPFKLGSAEKFLKAMLDIPFAFKRVDAMLYISNFDSEVDYLKKSFETLEAACEELRSNRMFLKLLEAVLKTGNRMNVGTNRGDAHAFKLDTLLKLVDVKGADGKTTLLHFVVQEIIRSEGARLCGGNEDQQSTTNDDANCRKLGLQVVSNLSSELINVKKAAAMDSEVLHSEVLKLSNGTGNIAEVVRSIEAVGLKDSSMEKFSESMRRFMKTAEEEIIRLQAQESVAMTLVKEITEYFHGDSAREEAHPFRIFMVVRDFQMVLDRVCKEVGMINERTIVSSAHKFPVPVNPNLQPAISGLTVRRQHSSSDEDSPSPK